MNSLPPTFNTSIFNTNAFSSGGYLTKSQADLLYAPYSSISYLTYLYGVTPGIVTASKAIVVDANKDISSFRNLTASSLISSDLIKLQNSSTVIFDELAATSLSALSLVNNTGTNGELNSNAISFLNSTSPVTTTTPNACITMIKTATGDSTGHLVFHTKSGLLNTSRCSERMRIQSDGFIAVNTFLANKQLSINHSTGACLRLIRNNVLGTETLYSDLSIDASGNLVMTSVGGYIDLQALKLNGSIVTASATELNYNDITSIGTIEASKACIVDSNKDITGFRNITLTGKLVCTDTSVSLTPASNSVAFSGGLYTAKAILNNSYYNCNTLNTPTSHAVSLQSICLNDHAIFFRGKNNSDTNHGLMYSGYGNASWNSTNGFGNNASYKQDGPVLFGYGGVMIGNLNSTGTETICATFQGTISTLFGSVNILGTTNSSSYTTGSLTTLGGVGISKDLFVSGKISTGSFLVLSGGISGVTYIDATSYIETTDTTESTSIITGSIITAGGLGVAKTITCTTLNTTTLGLTTLNVSGILTSTNTTASTAYTNGAIITAGGIGVAKASYFNSTVSMGTSSGGIMIGTSTDNTRLISCLQSGLTTSSSNYITHGVASTSNNQVEHSFYYAGSGSTSNLYEIGFYGGSRLFSLSALGRLNINNSGSLGSAVCQVQIQSAGYSLGLVYSTTYFTRMATIGDGRFALEVNTAGGSGGSTTAYFEYLSSGAMNLGLGLTPRFRLDLGNTTNDFMICLYNLNNLSPTFGIGANDSAMMYHSAGSNGHRWYINTTGGVGSPNTVGTKYMELTSAGLNIPSGAISSTINTYSTKHFSGSGVELNSIVNGNTDGGYGTYSNHPFNIRTNNTNRIQISATGNVGIGLSATYLLDVSHTSQNLTGGYAYYTSADTSGTGASTGNQNFSARFSGRIAVAGEVDVYSDKRIKTNIKDLDEAYVDKFMNLKPKSYIKKTTNRKEIGFIAQDVVKLGLDELYMLHHTEIDEEVEDDGFINPKDRIFTLNYIEMIPILFKKIQMMDKKIKDLEKNNLL